MKIYVLISTSNYNEGQKETVKVTEDIRLLYDSYLSYVNSLDEEDKDSLELEIWEDGKFLNVFYKDEVQAKIVEAINQEGGIKEIEEHHTENQ